MSEQNPENAQKIGASQELRVADSLAAAAGVSGLSVTLLQRLKDMGCPAFKGSRVYLDELDTYIDENPDVIKDLEAALGESDRLDVEFRRERVRKIRFQNDVEEGRYIAREIIAPRIFDIGVALKQILRTTLENELPQKIEGKSATDIRPVMREVVDALCKRFADETRQLAAKP